MFAIRPKADIQLKNDTLDVVILSGCFMNSKVIRHVIDWGGLMDWDRILAWFWTVLGFLFILGLVLQSLNIVLTVIALSLLVMWIKK